ncbi:uncharacterized protein KY384_002052 [Bacidia gigantensis]|uniref:uncharacterized protein n=1 Tax=Bacidia gigantensis TaxID=2732470 RepID=UPI001D051BA7|nr:uncharacterized protein KY384_002052 [Bacidia gigantensis]KAG8533269.1 hypothetical protein KY384_002052 [Bacidia gigantensis]
MTAPLQPFNPPVGILSNFCQPHPVTLKMKEKGMFSGSITGDDFSITDVNGREVCKCKGKVMSISARKIFTDPSGRELFHLKNKLLALAKSFIGESPDGKQLFEVKGKFSRLAIDKLLAVLSSKSTISFINASTNQSMTLDLKGDWLDRSAEVTLQGRPVATISRSFLNFGQLVSDKQTYYVNCAPGVDLVLMAAICVCLDERENDK